VLYLLDFTDFVFGESGERLPDEPQRHIGMDRIDQRQRHLQGSRLRTAVRTQQQQT
jgi:hypothetical protein